MVTLILPMVMLFVLQLGSHSNIDTTDGCVICVTADVTWSPMVVFVLQLGSHGNIDTTYGCVICVTAGVT